MAETIADHAISYENVSGAEYDFARAAGDKIFVIISGEIDPDAAPSDTTLYTVPSGRILYVQRISWGRETLAGITPLYDSAGNTASGAIKVSVVSSERNYGMYTTDYLTPVTFRKGITVDSGDLAGEKDQRFVIQGYLI